MGFFQKIKQFLGIGGVKATLDIPKESKKEDLQVAGKLKLFSKS
jgi:hypothetical protein